MAKSRRARQRQFTHNEILQTARGQIREKGAAALSLRAIAREMGITAPAIYRYFASRDALVTALIARGYQSLRDRLAEIRVSVDGGHAQRLLEVGLAYRRWGLENPELYALIFGTPIPGYEAPAESTLPLAQSALGVLVGILAEGAQAGVFSLPEGGSVLRPGLIVDPPPGTAPALKMALRLWALVHGLTSLELFNHYQTLLEDPEILFLEAIQDVIQTLTKKGNQNER
jgi:AcrR family transcriptional regulator